MGSVLKKLVGIQVIFAASLGLAGTLNVGDIAPEVILSGITANGQPVVSSISSAPGPTQSYTLIEFFETEDAQSRANLFTLAELAVDMEEFVATHLVAMDEEIKDVKAFVKNNQSDIKFPVHFDNRHDASRAFGVTQPATIYVLKNEKEVIFKYVGTITEEVQDQIRKAVGYGEK